MTIDTGQFPVWYERLNIPGFTLHTHQPWETYWTPLKKGKKAILHHGWAEDCKECWEKKLQEYLA